jgi:hypothetical protein
VKQLVLLPCLGLVVAVYLCSAHAQEEGPEHIRDNSFLIEEAYNQEAGVVQHIFNWFPTWDETEGSRRDFVFNYVMELPVGSETHQFSFSPLNFAYFAEQPLIGLPDEQGGWGDTLINYRYQVWTDDPYSLRPAVAPRFSLIAPTGDEDRGLGTGEFGFQFNLPISKELDPFAFHFNAGLTRNPNVSIALLSGLPSPGRDLRGYNLGGSVIWLATYDLNFLLELLILWDEELDVITGNRDATTSVLLDPGVRGALFTGEEVQWVVGLGFPVGLSEDAPDWGVFLYMSVEHIFCRATNCTEPAP